QKSCRSTKADADGFGAGALGDFVKLTGELRTGDPVRYGYIPRASAPSQISQYVAARKLAARREEVKQRNLVESTCRLIRQPSDERIDADAPTYPNLPFFDG